MATMKEYRVELKYLDATTGRTRSNKVEIIRANSLDALRKKILAQYGTIRIDARVYDGRTMNFVGELDMGYAGRPQWFSGRTTGFGTPVNFNGKLLTGAPTYIHDHTRFSDNGTPILKIWESFGELNVLGRKYDGEYVFGRRYDLKKGYWGGGTYAYSIKELERHPRVSMSGKLVVDNTRKNGRRLIG